MIHLLKGNLASQIKDAINVLKERQKIPAIIANFRDIEASLEIPKNKSNGDLSSNIALKKSKDTDLDAFKFANPEYQTLKLNW